MTNHEIDIDAKIEDAINGLRRINDELTMLTTCKKIQQELIARLLMHDKIGQTTYHIKDYEVIVKTSNRMSLDIKRYDELKESIPEGYDPIKVRQKTTHDIDKKMYDKSQNELCDSQKFIINEFITLSPAPLSVTVVKVIA